MVGRMTLNHVILVRIQVPQVCAETPLNAGFLRYISQNLRLNTLVQVSQKTVRGSEIRTSRWKVLEIVTITIVNAPIIYQATIYWSCQC